MPLHSKTVEIESIHDDVDYNSIMPDMIVNYMKCRVEATPFTDDVARRTLLDIVRRCVEEKKSRVLSNSDPETVASVTVTTRNGVRLEFCDFYSLLGLVITETDPVVFHESPAWKEIDLAHHRMLYAFARWMDICARKLFRETAPPTACLIPQSSIAGPYKYWLRTAIFPNLAKRHHHAAGRLIQQTNLRNFMPNGPDFGGKSPLQLIGKNIQFADCSETLPLIYLLNPRPTKNKLYLMGMTIDVAKAILRVPHFDRNAVHVLLKPACDNCSYTIRAIGTHLRVPDAPNSLPLYYRDLALPSNADSLPVKPNCWPCPTKLAHQEFECRNCRWRWWCSQECKTENLSQHLVTCRHFHVCTKCGTADHANSVCEECVKVNGRIPAHYCGGKDGPSAHKAADRENHRPWCDDANNKGLVPSLIQRGYTVQMD
ncbi:hypothetical protein R3P38DRAFT_1322675 [Favolaschia claudopus]|uniref:MYND-type domain-containing protein n=1 Tax=Favolaschia claudopus TaxID=2862362 RepID=A0AAW0AVW4_9AGAR